MTFSGVTLTRTQRRVAIGLGAVLALYVVLALVVKPLRSARARQADRSLQLKARIAEAQQAIANIAKLEKETAALRDALATDTNRLVLRPVLGSYPIQRDIHRLASESGFKVVSVREVGKEPILGKAVVRPEPQEKPAKAKAKGAKEPVADAPPTLARYLADVGGEGSYADVIDLIDRLEQDNPCLGVLSLSVRSVVQTPERHRVTMQLEWPVAADP
ncbi:MAG: hypothetical protein PHR35_06925, partial [Kiritimatiellae bacterium]|nr:hypothetical protein [Kiritimatiellia bacterium]